MKYAIPNFTNDGIIYFGERNEPHFPSAMVAGGITDSKNLKEHFGIQTPGRWIQVNNHFFNIKEDIDVLLPEIRKKLDEEGRQYVDGLIQQCFEAGTDLVKLAESVKSEAEDSHLHNEDLARLLEKFYHAAYDYCVYYNIAFFENPELEIAEELSKKYAGEISQKDLFELFTSPATLTAAEREQDDFLKLHIALSQSDDSRELIENHATQYGWLSVRFFLGHPWTADDIQRRLDAMKDKNSDALLQERLDARKKIEDSLVTLKPRIEAEDWESIQQVRSIVSLRTDRGDFFHQASSHVQTLVSSIAQCLKVSYEDLMYFSPPEVVAALQEDLTITDTLEDRKRAIVIYHAEDGGVLFGDEALSYIQERPILQVESGSADELEGVTAFKGVARGRVKILKSNEDIEKVEEGDILFAIMTTPNFIGAMEKAAAFVTDEGGILCHAAIVAREMKKPCLIATKKATTTFQDGDLVEVDATNGKVRRVQS